VLLKRIERFRAYASPPSAVLRDTYSTFGRAAADLKPDFVESAKQSIDDNNAPEWRKTIRQRRTSYVECGQWRC
jgi:hypothetical protein